MELRIAVERPVAALPLVPRTPDYQGILTLQPEQLRFYQKKAPLRRKTGYNPFEVPDPHESRHLLAGKDYWTLLEERPAPQRASVADAAVPPEDKTAIPFHYALAANTRIWY
jgi:hypothetical protein